MSSRSDGVCRFGVFEFDMKSLELRKTGVKLSIPAVARAPALRSKNLRRVMSPL
jgi:hypothetical protein